MLRLLRECCEIGSWSYWQVLLLLLHFSLHPLSQELATMALSRSCRPNQSISISSSPTYSIFSSTSSSSHHFSSSLSPCRCFSSSSSSQASTSGTMPETRSSRSDSARTSAGNPSNTASGGRRKPSGNRPRRSGPLPPYEQWVKGQGAQQFKSPPPGKGPHWISETVRIMFLVFRESLVLILILFFFLSVFFSFSSISALSPQSFLPTSCSSISKR